VPSELSGKYKVKIEMENGPFEIKTIEKEITLP